MGDPKYQKYVRNLGFEVVENLWPASCDVFKASDGNSLVTVKLGEKINYFDTDWTYVHVMTENRVLDRVREIDGIAKKVSFHRLEDTADRKLVALVKDYIEGKRLSYDCGKITKPDILVDAVNALHECGVARLDLAGWNIIVDQTGKPYMVDLGLCIFEEEASKEGFEMIKTHDLRRLDQILIYFQ